MRNLLIAGGIYHPFAETARAVAGLLAAAGIASEIVEGMGAGLDRLRAGGFDLVTLDALAFSLTQAEKYAPLRAEHAFAPSPAQREALAGHVARGGGLLGLHTAAICFDTWPDWGDLLGAAWVWGRSGHPMPDYLDVAPRPGHPITEGIGPFRVWDELYGDLRLAPDAAVLATAVCRERPDPQPVLTAREAGGRAVWSALGHDLTSFAAPAHGALLTRAARWACRAI